MVKNQVSYPNFLTSVGAAQRAAGGTTHVQRLRRGQQTVWICLSWLQEAALIGLQEATMGGYKRQPAATKRKLKRGDAHLWQVYGLCQHPHAERFVVWFWNPRGKPGNHVFFFCAFRSQRDHWQVWASQRDDFQVESQRDPIGKNKKAQWLWKTITKHLLKKEKHVTFGTFSHKKVRKCFRWAGNDLFAPAHQTLSLKCGKAESYKAVWAKSKLKSS